MCEPLAESREPGRRRNDANLDRLSRLLRPEKHENHEKRRLSLSFPAPLRRRAPCRPADAASFACAPTREHAPRALAVLQIFSRWQRALHIEGLAIS